MIDQTPNCGVWREQLDAYADDGLSQAEVESFEEHLRECPACAAEALGFIQLRRAMRAAAASRFAPTAEFRLRIDELAREKPSRMRWLSGNPVWVAGLAVIALVLLAMPVTVWERHVARQQAMAELLDIHVATMASANPVDVISTDRHTVKPWFQGKLPFTFNLPELKNYEYRLVGGKVVYFSGEPGAQLLFAVGKHEISVFVIEDRHHELDAMVADQDPDQLKGFNRETWTAAGLRYVAISDANATDLHGLAELLRAA